MNNISICMDLSTSMIHFEFQCFWNSENNFKVLRMVQVEPFFWSWKTSFEKDDFWLIMFLPGRYSR